MPDDDTPANVTRLLTTQEPDAEAFVAGMIAATMNDVDTVGVLAATEDMRGFTLRYLGEQFTVTVARTPTRDGENDHHDHPTPLRRPGNDPRRPDSARGGPRPRDE